MEAPNNRVNIASLALLLWTVSLFFNVVDGATIKDNKLGPLISVNNYFGGGRFGRLAASPPPCKPPFCDKLSSTGPPTDPQQTTTDPTTENEILGCEDNIPLTCQAAANFTCAIL